MQPRVTRIRRAPFLPSIFLSIAAAHAQTLSYGIDTGVGETDNVTLAHADKISQTMAVTDFDLDYQKKSQRLDVDAKGDFSYFDYLQNAYGNEFIGRFDGTAELALVPQRLTWSVREDFGKAPIDPFTPSTPTNLQTINTLSTGPDLHLPLAGASFVDLGARAAYAEYQTSPFTNFRASGSAAWGLRLSPLSSVSVNGDSQRVLFENTVLNTDFDRTNAFVRYELQGARTDLSADLGATFVGQNGRSTTGALAKLDFARKLSVSARLTASLGHEIIDGTTNFSSLQGGALGVIGTAPAVNTSENYTSDHGSVGVDFRRNRTTLSISGRWERDYYPGEAILDRTLITGELRAQRQLTRALAVQITGRLYQTDYRNATVVGMHGSPDTTTGLVGASVTWRHGRALELKLACEHSGYTTSPNDTSYKENRVFVTVGYRPYNRLPISDAIPEL